jgi:hypothetical protein
MTDSVHRSVVSLSDGQMPDLFNNQKSSQFSSTAGSFNRLFLTNQASDHRTGKPQLLLMRQSEAGSPEGQSRWGMVYFF